MDYQNFMGILEQHHKWVESKMTAGAQAVFRHEDLSGLNLSKQNLHKTRVSKCKPGRS